MKKLIAILTLSLSFLVNTYANEIKHKRIECDFKFTENRFHNYFFVILNNDKFAKLFKHNYEHDLVTERFDVEHRLLFINFNKSGEIKYQINRENGELFNFKELRTDGICFKMEDGFNPEAFLSGVVEQNIKKQKEKNKF